MPMDKTNGSAPPGYRYIFVAYITTKTGTRIYARARGLKAFRIRVKKK